MVKQRGRVHRAVRRVPGVQAIYRELRIRRALRRGVVEIDAGTSTRVRVSTRSIAELRLRPAEKEPWTLDWARTRVRGGDVLWDVGANVGTYALIAARLAPGVTVVAVEPGPGNYASLCENVQLNGLEDTVIPLPVALGSSTRIGRLTLSDLEPGAALHQLDVERPGAPAQSVLVHSIDDLVTQVGLPAPTLLKIDVDGAEPAVLAGAHAALSSPALRSVIVEIDEGNGDSVVQTLLSCGLTLQDRISERDGVPLPDVWYGIFERREH